MLKHVNHVVDLGLSWILGKEFENWIMVNIMGSCWFIGSCGLIHNKH